VAEVSGLGGLNPSPGGLVLALVQSRVPAIIDRDSLARNANRLASVVSHAKAELTTIDLFLFPEYSLNGMIGRRANRDDLLTAADSEEVDILRQACVDAGVWACYSILEPNPNGAPFNSGVIVDPDGQVQLHYRKLHPMVPYEPWQPGDLGIPVCAGPKGSVLALLICHDGMFPEMAREAAYRGANVILRTAAYPDPVKHAWRITNQANAFSNLAYTASVALGGLDDDGFGVIGDAMICDVEGNVLVEGDTTADRILTGEVVPSRSDDARRGWAAENNIYQLGHRGYVAVRGGVQDCPYTYISDLAAGRYRVPWEDEVEVTDGTREGYPERGNSS